MCARNDCEKCSVSMAERFVHFCTSTRLEMPPFFVWRRVFILFYTNRAAISLIYFFFIPLFLAFCIFVFVGIVILLFTRRENRYIHLQRAFRVTFSLHQGANATDFTNFAPPKEIPGFTTRELSSLVQIFQEFQKRNFLQPDDCRRKYKGQQANHDILHQAVFGEKRKAPVGCIF